MHATPTNDPAAEDAPTPTEVAAAAQSMTAKQRARLMVVWGDLDTAAAMVTEGRRLERVAVRELRALVAAAAAVVHDPGQGA